MALWQRLDNRRRQPPIRLLAWWHQLAHWQRDLLGTLPVAVLVLVGSWQFDGTGSTDALIVAGGWALICLRRVVPFVAFVGSVVFALALVRVDDTGVSLLAIATTLYSVVAYHDRVRPLMVGAIAVAAATALVLLSERVEGSNLTIDLITACGVVILTVQLARSVRVNRQKSDELLLRAQELDQLRKTEANEAVLAERARIARELHDIAAHHVSGIAVLSRAQARRTNLDAQAARDALDVVAREAGEAMVALRSLVSVLRTESDDQEMQPQPGLADIDELIAAFIRIGMQVTLTDPLPALATRVDVGLATYRIVQEALANVMRHSHGAHAWVSVTVADEYLVVQVDDNGRTGPAPGQRRGHGTVGMSERALLNGGTFELSTSDRGGWRVRATLATVPKGRVSDRAGTSTVESAT
jgi:signal transduction histidine kinase